MKRFKLFCSAIAALTVLALAGCDMEVPDSEKVNVIPGLVMSGKGATSYGDTMTAYSKAMIGSWNVSTYTGGTLEDGKIVGATKIAEGETVTGDKWWSNNEQTTTASLEDNSTVIIEATALAKDNQVFFEATDGTNYISVNPHNDAWGTGVTYNSYGAPAVEVGTVIRFYITRSGNTVSFKVSVVE